MPFELADRPSTFRTHLEQMQRDLVVIVTELNRHSDWEPAMRAQASLLALDHLISADVDLDDDEYFPWPLPTPAAPIDV